MNPTLKRHQDTGEHLEIILQESPVVLVTVSGNSRRKIGKRSDRGNYPSLGLYSNKKVLERKEVMVRVSVFIIPKPSNIIIDRLSVTVPIASLAEHAFIVKCFEYGGKLKEWGHMGLNKKYHTYYAHPFVGKGITMYLQYPQYYGVKNTLRIDFNPSKVEMKQVQALINQMMQNGFKRLIEHGRISRIDTACDYAWIKPHNLLFYAPNYSIGLGIYKSGNIQTAYLGEHESGYDQPVTLGDGNSVFIQSAYLGDSASSQWAIYDKVAEIKSKNHGKEFKTEVPNHDLTRIEFRHRPSDLLLLKDVLSMKNPFNTLKLIAYPKAMSSNDSTFKLLLALSRFQGMNQALLNIEKHHRPKYNKMLMECGKTNWFKPDTIWESFSSAVHQIAHPYESLLSTP